MQRLLETLGRIAYWCAWPGLFVFLRNSERTRAVIAHGDEILVVRSWLSDGRWELPGGGLHRGEAIRRGTLREIREETGLTLRHEQLRFLGQAEARSHGFGFLVHTYAVELKKKPQLTRQRHEIARVSWVDWHDLHPGNATGDVLDAIRAWVG